MDQASSSGGIWAWQIVKLIVVSSLILFSLFLWVAGFTEEGIRLVIRWSARISATCFCIAFAGSALHLWLQNSVSFWLFRNRKYFGISFALLHLMHLGALFVLQNYFHPVFERAANFSLFAGGMAYLFLVSMFLTSFERFSKLLTGRQWKLLHTVGGYWIWFIFFNSYFKGILRAEYWDLPLLLILVSVLILRGWKLFKRKRDTLTNQASRY